MKLYLNHVYLVTGKVYDQLKNLMIKNKQIAKVYWITGLSGSGKTTVAKEFIKLLNNIGHKCINIDGDELRKIIGGGFTKWII